MKREAYLVGEGADGEWRIAPTTTIFYLFYGHAIDHKPDALFFRRETNDASLGTLHRGPNASQIAEDRSLLSSGQYQTGSSQRYQIIEQQGLRT